MSNRASEIYGYSGGRWTVLDGAKDVARDEMIVRAKSLLRQPEVVAVRLLMERSEESGRVFVAFRAEKEPVPELDILQHKKRSAQPRAVPAAAPRKIVDEAPPAPATLQMPPDPAEAPPQEGRADGRAKRGSGGAWLGVLGFGVVTAGCILLLLAQRTGRAGLDPNNMAITGGAVLGLLVGGLMMVRQVLRIEGLIVEVAGPAPPQPRPRTVARPAPAGPAPHAPAEAEPPAASAPDEPHLPDRVALMPILRLVAANLEWLRQDGSISADPMVLRLACRPYVAGACDERAQRYRADPAELTTDCLALLGDAGADAAAYAGRLAEYLLQPRHQRLYRAGRADLANRVDGPEPGPHFTLAIRDWLNNPDARPAGNLIVVGVAPLAPQHQAAVEAVVGAYGGHAFSRDGTEIVATFTDPFGAADLARAIRDAIRAAPSETPAGIGLTIVAPSAFADPVPPPAVPAPVPEMASAAPPAAADSAAALPPPQAAVARPAAGTPVAGTPVAGTPVADVLRLSRSAAGQIVVSSVLRSILAAKASEYRFEQIDNDAHRLLDPA